MYISDATFDSLFYCLNGTAYDIITLLICIIQKRKYLQNEKRYSKRKSLSNKQQLFSTSWALLTQEELKLV